MGCGGESREEGWGVEGRVGRGGWGVEGRVGRKDGVWRGE